MKNALALLVASLVIGDHWTFDIVDTNTSFKMNAPFVWRNYIMCVVRTGQIEKIQERVVIHSLEARVVGIGFNETGYICIPPTS